jgi:hypothetical protein
MDDASAETLNVGSESDLALNSRYQVPGSPLHQLPDGTPALVVENRKAATSRDNRSSGNAATAAVAIISVPRWRQGDETQGGGSVARGLIRAAVRLGM